VWAGVAQSVKRLVTGWKVWGSNPERQGREQQDNASNRHTGRGHRQGELAVTSIDTGGEGVECIVRVRVII
jgi:hypothetical protein